MKRNNFNLSHTHLLTARFGELVPIACQEVIPGDTFRMSSSLLVRMAPMLAPVMTPIKVRIHHWYVPYRILDPNWEDFIVDNNSNITLPELGYNNQSISKGKGTLLDYMGIYVSPGGPTTTNANRTHLNAYPFMAYDMIWNEFYRDEDLQAERTWRISSSSTINVSHYLTPAKVAWRKDRFTTARPWTQKGDQVFVPTYTATANKEWTEVRVSLTSWKMGGTQGENGLNWSGNNFLVTSRNKLMCVARSNQNNPAGTCPVGGNISDLSGFWNIAVKNVFKRLMLAKFPNWAAIKAYIDNPANPTTFTISGKGVAADYNGADTAGATGLGNFVNLTFTFNCRLDQYRRQGPNTPILETFNWQINNPFIAGTAFLTTSNSSMGFNVYGNELIESGAMSIRDLRLASSLQRYQENKAKWGSRYIEYLQYLGVKSSDARLQLPEYLGGGSQYIQTSEVLQTSPGSTGVVGSMYGHGIGAMRTNRFTKFFEEHGIILSLMSIVPDSGYAQGTKRFFFKKTWADFFQKDLQDIGMQEVLNGELFTANNRAVDFDTFGYQDRYNEYRKEQSYISGDFHDTLSHWHLFRMFDQTPALNSSFIECNPSMRIFADQESDPFWIFCRHSVVAKRMISKRANTKLR